jgi:hypothetical protein
MVEKVSSNLRKESLKIKNLELSLCLADEGLKLTVVNLHNENIHETTLNKTKIQEISEKFIPDEEALYELLVESTNKPTNSLRSDISENKINILFLQDYPFKRKINISIPLVEKKVDDPLEKLQRTIVRQAKRIDDLEKIIFSPSGVEIFPFYNHQTQSIVTYKTGNLSKENKLITRNGSNNGTYFTFEANQPLDINDKKQFFRVLITSVAYPETPYIFVGLTTLNSIVNTSGQNSYSQPGTYLFHCQNGNAHRNGAAKAVGYNIPSGSVVEISCNYKTKLVTFSIGEENLVVMPLSTQDYNSKLYPTVMIANNSEFASFF